MSEERAFVYEEADLERRYATLKLGERGEFVMREPSIGDAKKWKNAHAKLARFDGGKFVGVNDGSADLEGMLVGMCLFDPKGFKISPKLVSELPPRILADLYDKCLKMSELIPKAPREVTDPDLVKMCRKTLTVLDDRRADAKFTEGVEAALQWLVENRDNKEVDMEVVKNERDATPTVSALPSPQE